MKQEKNINEKISDIIKEMNETADIPCAHPYCASRDGKCAKKSCGGYMTEEEAEEYAKHVKNHI